MDTLISLVGIVVLLLIAFLLSSNKKAINFRTVLGALAFQIGPCVTLIQALKARSLLHSGYSPASITCWPIGDWTSCDLTPDSQAGTPFLSPGFCGRLCAH